MFGWFKRVIVSAGYVPQRLRKKKLRLRSNTFREVIAQRDEDWALNPEKFWERMAKEYEQQLVASAEAVMEATNRYWKVVSRCHQLERKLSNYEHVEGSKPAEERLPETGFEQYRDRER